MRNRDISFNNVTKDLEMTQANCSELYLSVKGKEIFKDEVEVEDDGWGFWTWTIIIIIIIGAAGAGFFIFKMK